MALEGNRAVGPGKKVLGAVGLIAGAAIGIYSGINTLIPLGATAGIWWIGKKTFPESKLLFLPPFAVQAGHLLWLSFGFLYLGTLNDNWIDVVVLVVGLAWLIAKPGLGPIVFLSVFQSLALGVNVFSFLGAAVGSNMHKALLVHMIWRGLALFFMAQAYASYRTLRRAQPAAANSEPRSGG